MLPFEKMSMASHIINQNVAISYLIPFTTSYGTFTFPNKSKVALAVHLRRLYNQGQRFLIRLKEMFAQQNNRKKGNGLFMCNLVFISSFVVFCRNLHLFQTHATIWFRVQIFSCDFLAANKFSNAGSVLPSSFNLIIFRSLHNKRKSRLSDVKYK